MTQGNVLQTWKDYGIFFGITDQRTIEKRLINLKVKIPAKGAPMMRLEVLQARIDAQQK